MTTQPLMVSWGGGRNSTAMLVGMEDFGFRPDAILFSDTGGEKPETYTYLVTMQTWLKKVGFPPIITVRNSGMYDSLEDNCLKKEMLPSLAYGYKSCSDKYKRRPQEKWAKSWRPALDCWEMGSRVKKAIGYDADEQRRAKIKSDKHYEYWYPLIEWNWTLDTCIHAIECAGLPTPPKSACFFCPASRKPEIIELSKKHPDLFQRAVAMERIASKNFGSIKGLGRRFSWEAFVKATEEEQHRIVETIEEPCGCFDGEYD